MTTFEKVYEAVRRIPAGSVATYGQVAEAVGNKRLSRVVGYALHVNPQPGVIPCHRVVKRDGEGSSAFAFGGGNRQIELLQEENERLDQKIRMMKGNRDTLERYAREQFYFAEPGDDVYIIE